MSKLNLLISIKGDVKFQFLTSNKEIKVTNSLSTNAASILREALMGDTRLQSIRITTDSQVVVNKKEVQYSLLPNEVTIKFLISKTQAVGTIETIELLDSKGIVFSTVNGLSIAKEDEEILISWTLTIIL